MLLLSDIIDHVLVDTGHLVLNLDDLMLNNRQFIRLCEKQIRFWGRYRPQKGSTTVSAPHTFSPPEVVPSAIVSVVSGNSGIPMASTLWTYDKESACLSVRGSGSIVARVEYIVSEHKYDETVCGWPTITKYTDELLDLIVAQFMITVGMSRRAFTPTELNLSTDADMLVSEGKELLRETRDMIAQTGSEMSWVYGVPSF